MSKLSVGVVNYGVGNLSSVRHCLQELNFRCRVSDDTAILASCDLLLLPGVGAFPLAMRALQETGLDRFLIDQSTLNKPILGICLGMHLLTDASYEGEYTKGLGLIPGEVVSFGQGRWHIGWNTVEKIGTSDLLDLRGDESFYFNHSHFYCGADEFKVCKTSFGDDFASVIQCRRTLGMQFHPEKSQSVGHTMLKQVVQGMCDA